MSENYTPKVGDYVKVNVNVLLESTMGTIRATEVNNMKLNDGDKVFRVIGEMVYTYTGETMYILDEAMYIYKACELVAYKT